MSDKKHTKVTLLGKKVGMTQVFDDQNRLVPVTVVEAGPCPVVQLKNLETDGYQAVQIGFEEQKEQRLSKASKGHFKKNGATPCKNLKEFRTSETDAFASGDVLTVDQFEEGQIVDVIGNTKGHGFQGVMKRWNFSGGRASHGSMFHRRGGSYGQCQWPGRVYKNRKMPGHMGDKQRTAQNLVIVKIIKEKNLLLIKGSFPGSKGSIVAIRTAKKAKKKA